jgi:hypothetical protein
MVGHETPGVQCRAAGTQRPTQPLATFGAVAIATEDPAALDAADDDVMESAVEIETRTTRHPLPIAERQTPRTGCTRWLHRCHAR